MAYAFNIYSAGSSQTDYTIAFPYIKEEHVKVYVNFVDTSFTFHNATTARLSSAPASGTRVEVRRVTPPSAVLVDYADGSTLTASDLDTSNLQHLYLAQEEKDNNEKGLSISATTGLPTLNSQRLTNVADPTGAQDAVTKAYLERTGSITSTQIANGTIVNDDIANTTITAAKIVNDTITGTQIAANAIGPSELSANSVGSSELADDAVDRAAILNDAVNGDKIADDSINSEHYVDASIDHQHLSNDCIDGDNIQDDVVNSEHVAAGSLDNEHYAAGSITSDKLNAATVVTASEQAAASANDTSFFTTSASDARYFNISSGDTIKDGQSFPDNDTTIATTAAINDRIIDLIEEVGGFVPLVSEATFPAANPDINNGPGTIISVGTLSTTYTPSSGTCTIPDSTLTNISGSNVTITDCGSTTLSAGFGILVETTTTLHTYKFHRLVPKATEVTTVAGISGNVTTVATNNANVTTVATNIANINTVATNNTNITNVGSNISNVNTAATNLADIENFSDVYQIATSAPTQRTDSGSLATGDLWFDSSSNKQMMVYDGSAGDGYSAMTPSQATLDDIAVVSGNITYIEDLGLITEALSTGTGNSIETCADNITKIQTCHTNIANINTVAADQTDIGAVAGKATEIGRLGTAAAVADLAILGTTDVVNDMNLLATTDCIADMALLGTADCVADMALLGTADCISDMNALASADVIADMNTLATTDIVADLNKLATTDIVNDMNTLATTSNVNNMNTVAGSISNVNTVGGSIADVNRYANEYKIASSAPGSPSQGDLWYDSSNTVLKYRTASAWESIAPGIADVVQDTTPQLGGALDGQNNNMSNIGTIDGSNLQLDFGTL
tara:strand:+ start:19821 stop:22385 length:2565 start_codon:yes stop_codon:yes gene_type:complete